jgi:hypothetical protein
MFKNLLKKISINLSFYYFKKKKFNKKKHFKISNFLDKKINIFFKKNPRLFTHAKLSNEIHKIISKKQLDNFLKNPIIQNIFFIHNRFFIRKELAELRKDKYWSLWKKLIIENDIGRPIRYFLYPKSSGNRIRQVYLIQKFLRNTVQINLNKLQTIIELGGGYGCMAQIFCKLNKKINYNIYDMYEVNLLQYYYLMMNNLKTNLSIEKLGINLISKIRDLNKIKTERDVDLFIANWSLSEFPLKFREKFIPTIKSAKYSIICFQEKFENINNTKFFKGLIKKFKKNYEYKFIDFKYYNQSPFNNTNHQMLILIKK